MQYQDLEQSIRKAPPIYTRLGDQGTTQLGSLRLSKHHDRVRLVGQIQWAQMCVAELIAYWRIDDLSKSFTGPNQDLDLLLKRKIKNDVDVQLDRLLYGLFFLGGYVGSDSLTPFYNKEGEDILRRWTAEMEQVIDLIQEDTPAPHGFSWASTTDVLYNRIQHAMCHIRALESAIAGEAVLDLTVFSAFFNRASDLLYAIGVYTQAQIVVDVYYEMSKTSLINYMRGNQ